MAFLALTIPLAAIAFLTLGYVSYLVLSDTENKPKQQYSEPLKW